jgi:CRP/FNR family transcriptional regulator
VVARFTTHGPTHDAPPAVAYLETDSLEREFTTDQEAGALMISKSNNLGRMGWVSGEKQPFLALKRTGRLRGDERRELLEMLREAGAATVCKRYDRGEVIYEEGESDGALYVVADGVAKLAKTYSDGKVATLRLLGAQDVLGNLALCGETPPRARAEAFTACEVIKVPKVFVERAVKKSPEVAFELLRLLGRELALREEWANCLLPYKAEARLANLLPILAREFGEATLVGFVIGLRLTHDELSEMIASTRESVTNALKRLRESGVLATKRGRIVILEPGGLAEAARRKPCSTAPAGPVPVTGQELISFASFGG